MRGPRHRRGGEATARMEAHAFRVASAARPTQARDAGSVPAVEPEPTKPRFEMHGTAPAEILATVTSAGGSVSAVQVDGSAARHWPSYFYFVTK